MKVLTRDIKEIRLLYPNQFENIIQFVGGSNCQLLVASDVDTIPTCTTRFRLTPNKSQPYGKILRKQSLIPTTYTPKKHTKILFLLVDGRVYYYILKKK